MSFLKQEILDLVANLNFAGKDLTATGDRTHDFTTHAATIKGLTEFNLMGAQLMQTVAYGDVAGVLYIPNFSEGANDLLFGINPNSGDTLSVIINVDGVESSPITFTKTELFPGTYVYLGPPAGGTTITCVSYSGMLYAPVKVGIDAEEVEPYDYVNNRALYLTAADNKIRKATIPEPLQRFGKSGEDSAAAEDRHFDASSSVFAISNANSFGVSSGDGSGTSFYTIGGNIGTYPQAILWARSPNSLGGQTDGLILISPNDTYRFMVLKLGDGVSVASLQIFTNKFVFGVNDSNPPGDPLTMTFLLSKLPVFADDTAAGTGGMLTHQVYKTSTGELRIKL